MKLFRLWILLLIAVALPLRVAVGASVACPAAEALDQVGSATGLVAQDHHDCEQTRPTQGHVPDGKTHGATGHAACCAAVLAAALPIPAAAAFAGSEPLAAADVPEQPFESEALERPPRTA